jgi:hypothetical protein
MAEDDRRRGEIRTASPLGNENQKQSERNAALERDGYVHHRNTGKVKGSSLSESEVTVISRTNLLPGKFLVEISGTRTSLDESPMELSVDTSDPKEHMYFKPVLSKRKFVLSQRPGEWMRILVSGAMPQEVTFNDKNAAKVDASALAAKVYFKREGKPSDDSAKLDEALQTFKQKCGYSLSGQIKRAESNKTLFQKKNVGNFCVDALSGAISLCSEEMGKSALKTGLKSFTCEPGPKGGASITRGGLVVTFDEDQPSLSDEVAALLEETL